MVGLLNTPAIDAGADVLVDWLELSALFDEFSRARLDELASSAKVQEERPADDFGDGDLKDDQLRDLIEVEITTRQKALAAAYPFELDRDGEELRLTVQLDQPKACLYLLCLITSHISRSPLVTQRLSNALVQRLRNRVFQVLGTLAVAGMVRGSAVSVGYPRETKEGILDVLRRAEEWGSGLIARDKPGTHAAPRAKDGGIDVMGWPQSDRPPPPHIFFAQLASGENWVDKPTEAEYANFMDDFIDGGHGGQTNFMTLIPYRVIDELAFVRESKRHKSLCDRTRAPLYALNALDLAGQGIPMDEVNNVNQIVDWINDYRAALQAGEAID